MLRHSSQGKTAVLRLTTRGEHTPLNSICDRPFSKWRKFDKVNAVTINMHAFTIVHVMETKHYTTKRMSRQKQTN